MRLLVNDRNAESQMPNVACGVRPSAATRRLIRRDRMNASRPASKGKRCQKHTMHEF
jgi:hypothetical protein